ASVMGWPNVSFGDYVRAVARVRGLDGSQREVLQLIGASLIDENYEEFCRSVVAQAKYWQPGKPLVIDGIRHLQIKHALEKIVVPSRFILAYISLDDQTRKQRIWKERQIAPESLEYIDSNSTEAQVTAELLKAADFMLDGTKSIPALIEELKT